MSSTLTATVDLGILGELDVEVEYSYSAGTPDVMYMPNGDPGYPGDPPEFEIFKVTFNGENVTFLFVDCDKFSDMIEMMAADSMDDPEPPEPDYYDREF